MNIFNTKTIISSGSVDGVLTTAALLRLIGRVDVNVIFTQAFDVYKIDVSSWLPDQLVVFVDLAVNNRQPKMTADFVAAIANYGHQIIGVCDEHDSEAWGLVLNQDSDLIIKPQSQSKGGAKSSGAILAQFMHQNIIGDVHALALCHLADDADQMMFYDVAQVANKAIKANLGDNARREHIARRLAKSLTPDAPMVAWAQEYEEMEYNQALLLQAATVAGGVMRIDARGKRIDMTSLMREMYASAQFALVITDNLVSIGTKDASVNLMQLLFTLEPSGFASKVNIQMVFDLQNMEYRIGALLGVAPDLIPWDGRGECPTTEPHIVVTRMAGVIPSDDLINYPTRNWVWSDAFPQTDIIGYILIAYLPDWAKHTARVVFRHPHGGAFHHPGREEIYFHIYNNDLFGGNTPKTAKDFLAHFEGEPLLEEEGDCGWGIWNSATQAGIFKTNLTVGW